MTTGESAAKPAAKPTLSSRRGAKPVRTCIGCRQRGPADSLVRVVVLAGVLTPDLDGRRQGRGAHVHLDATCVSAAGRGWARALKTTGPFDDSLVRGLVWPKPNRTHPNTPFDHESAGESE